MKHAILEGDVHLVCLDIINLEHPLELAGPPLMAKEFHSVVLCLQTLCADAEMTILVIGYRDFLLREARQLGKDLIASLALCDIHAKGRKRTADLANGIEWLVLGKIHHLFQNVTPFFGIALYKGGMAI